MSDLERWIDGDAPDDVAALLRAARAEAPSAGALERALAGAAAGAAALGATAAAAAAGAPSTAAAAGGAVTAGGALSLAALAKPLLGGFLAGAIFCAGVAVVSPPPSPLVAPTAASATAAAPAALAASVPAGAPATPALDAPGAALPASPASLLAPAASSLEDAALQAEVSLVDRVRRALDSGDPEAALVLLERHAREHGAAGRLAPEARALRLEALVRLGRKGEARAVAREILAQDRGTPHQAKAEAALADRAPTGSAIDAEPGGGARLPAPAPKP